MFASNRPDDKRHVDVVSKNLSSSFFKLNIFCHSDENADFLRTDEKERKRERERERERE